MRKIECYLKTFSCLTTLWSIKLMLHKTMVLDLKLLHISSEISITEPRKFTQSMAVGYFHHWAHAWSHTRTCTSSSFLPPPCQIQEPETRPGFNSSGCEVLDMSLRLYRASTAVYFQSSEILNLLLEKWSNRPPCANFNWSTCTHLFRQLASYVADTIYRLSVHCHGTKELVWKKGCLKPFRSLSLMKVCF